MCDTVVVVRDGRVLFAKNSDRDPNEAQLLDWQPRGEHPTGAEVQCSWVSIPQVRQTHAVLLSRPFWCWGAEMGANEHGVTIGNEAVFTTEKVARVGLTGMDLVRLALERADTAADAVEVLTRLVETVGQGGGAGHEDPGFRYHNSFLVADPGGAFVLETAGRHWAVERVDGARSISNGLTIGPFAERYGDFVKTRVARARTRCARTQVLAEDAQGVNDLMQLLRDHGPGRDEPAYSLWNGGLDAPCVHAGGLVAASQTTASWVAELGPDGCRHWVTATAAPCTGIFKPVRVDERLDLGPEPTDEADARSLWWRHERLHRLVARDHARLLSLYAAERDAVEARWIADPPAPPDAFAKADRLLERWTQAVREQARAPDRRPFHVRRYWRRRARRAGLDDG
jgi:dipeptidase